MGVSTAHDSNQINHSRKFSIFLNDAASPASSDFHFGGAKGRKQGIVSKERGYLGIKERENEIWKGEREKWRKDAKKRARNGERNREKIYQEE